MKAVRRLAWRLFGLSVVGYIIVVTIWQTTADYQRYNVDDFREIGQLNIPLNPKNVLGPEW